MDFFSVCDWLFLSCVFSRGSNKQLEMLQKSLHRFFIIIELFLSNLRLLLLTLHVSTPFRPHSGLMLITRRFVFLFSQVLSVLNGKTWVDEDIRVCRLHHARHPLGSSRSLPPPRICCGLCPKESAEDRIETSPVIEYLGKIILIIFLHVLKYFSPSCR